MGESIRHDLTLDEYLQIDAMSASGLNNARRSALKYLHEKKSPTAATEAMRVGSAAHCAILEPNEFDRRYAVYTERRGTNAYKAFDAERPGQTILKPDQWNGCKRMAKAVREHPAAGPLLADGKPEVSMFWANNDFGVDGKLRIDWFREGDSIVEIKTTQDVRPDKFKWDCGRYGYHVKFAWYQDGVTAVTGLVLPTWVIAVESKQPHDVVVYRVPEYVIDQGRADYEDALNTLRECRTSGRYPGVSDTVLELELPAFAYAPDEELTLTIGDEKVRV